MVDSAEKLDAAERLGLSPYKPHLLWFGLLLLVTAPTLLWLVHRWTSSVYSNTIGVFMPFIIGYLVAENLRAEPVREPQASAWGFPFLIAGLAMIVLDTSIHTQLMAAVGFVLCMPGLFLLLLGVQRTQALAFPLCLGFLMLPIPAGAVHPVHLLLRHITAWGTELLMKLANAVQLVDIPMWREGTLIQLPNGPLRVADACSGFSTLQAAMVLALILSFMSKSVRKGLFLIGAGVILTLIANSIRVFLLTLVVHYLGVDLLETWLHEGSGMVTFVIVLVGLFLIAGRPPESNTVGSDP